MQNYTVYEVADLLGTSHTTIYNKINNKEIYKELRNFIKKQGKTTYIAQDGIDVLKNHLPNKETLKKDSVNFTSENNQENFESTYKSSNKADLELYKKMIESLESQIEDLKNDKAKLFTEIEQQRLLHQNTQVILKQSQNKVELLESQEQKKKRLFNWFGKNQ